MIGHSRRVASVAFSKYDKYIISGSDDNSIKLWLREKENDFVILKTLVDHCGRVASVAFSKDDENIISGSWDYSIKIWDRETGILL